jgi:hypothetical protein
MVTIYCSTRRLPPPAALYERIQTREREKSEKGEKGEKEKKNKLKLSSSIKLFQGRTLESLETTFYFFAFSPFSVLDSPVKPENDKSKLNSILGTRDHLMSIAQR